MNNKNNLGGWAIDIETFKWITSNIKHGSNILELGSGSGTIELSYFYKMFSIEHNQKYLNKAKNATYLHTDIINEFYDLEKIKHKLPKQYELLLIDGPPKSISNRFKFLDFINFFNLKTNILVDDTNREEEQELLFKISEITGRKCKIIGTKEKSFGIIPK
jgi:hypothetical protein